MGLIQKIAQGLKKTKDFLFGGIQRVLNKFTVIDDELFEELEEQMIMSDIGVETSEEICEQLRKKIKERGITDPKEIMELIHEVISDMMGDDTGLDLSVSPAVIMVIGVNGAGKTTTIGKLSHQFRAEGKKVLVAAADTFRAAAIDQLQVWTDRAGVDIVKHTEGSDPGAVVYDALDAAQARKCDVVIIDTAGRLHNKKNLMEELAKINRIIDKKAPESSREVLLVLDATTGQNAVSQARLFSETAPITGIVLTKLDGTAKGGIVISIKNELGIPVKMIGVGEKIDDLQPFDSRMFVDALFSSMPERESDEDDDEKSEIADESDEIESETEDNEPETAEAEPETVENEPETEVIEPETVEAEPETEVNEPEAVETEPETEVVETEAVETEPEAEVVETEAVETEENETPADSTPDNEPVETVENSGAESEEAAENTEEEPEKKKKRGFFSRLFGRKGKDDDDK